MIPEISIGKKKRTHTHILKLVYEKKDTHIPTHPLHTRIFLIEDFLCKKRSAYKRQSRDIFEGSLSKQLHFPVCLGISVIN